MEEGSEVLLDGRRTEAGAAVAVAVAGAFTTGVRLNMSDLRGSDIYFYYAKRRMTSVVVFFFFFLWRISKNKGAREEAEKKDKGGYLDRPCEVSYNCLRLNFNTVSPWISGDTGSKSREETVVGSNPTSDTIGVSPVRLAQWIERFPPINFFLLRRCGKKQS